MSQSRYLLAGVSGFAPIAPRTFDEAFRRLGINLRTNRRCSWDNYPTSNDALEAVRERLKTKLGLADARHVDARSFCWMLVRTEDKRSGGEEAPGAVRYVGASRRPIANMAANPGSLAAQSGRQATTTRKKNDMHHHQRELETIIERRITQQEAILAMRGLVLRAMPVVAG
ncbi:MAG: hypothetical protein EOP66_06065 [Sphingomonas sp.]|nr:MAG: hypothetical protein EOP66_06065 [Sphingomonas sp.]